MNVASDLSYLSDRTNIDCICGRDRGCTVRRRDRYGIRFIFKLCTTCGHVRTSNPLSFDTTRRFYQSSDYRSLYFAGENPEQVLLRKTPSPNSVSQLLKFVEGLGISKGRLIEWGCGGGWNLVPFRDAGWTVQGFDYDKPYLELGRTLLGLELDEIPPESSSMVPMYPDVVLLNHVLEHALDPVSLLARLRAMCSSETSLIVGVPLLETIPIWHWRDFFHIAHVHYFSAESLARVAASSGFQITHFDLSSGMFVLKKSDSMNRLPTKRRFALRSMLLLVKGFIEPTYRTRQFIRFILSSLGLIDLVRRARKRIAR